MNKEALKYFNKALEIDPTFERALKAKKIFWILNLNSYRWKWVLWAYLMELKKNA